MGTTNNVPAEIVNDPDMRSQPNFQSGAELPDEAGMAASVLRTHGYCIGGGARGKNKGVFLLFCRLSSSLHEKKI